MHAISILALLLPLVAAHSHKQCDCMTWSDGQDWGHNAILTHFVCVEDYNHRAVYDDATKRCVVTGDNRIDGDEWESLCRRYGVVEGFAPIGPKNEPVFPKYPAPPLRVGAAAGSCPDRP
ncbi:hypothetical protein E4U30_004480 [Claviceps sp. LM220 group G6]|nr:hypothetical protein E4U15_001474 [Claviceps sp. LM218 group G6]KAG6093276.1 hypothetical protein E4U30_004480 [Claviceps sp. LM220 group G6]